MAKLPKRPRDTAQLAKFMVEMATGDRPKDGPLQHLTTMQFLLGDGIKAEVRFIGGSPEPEHIATLEAYLKITGAALKKET